MSYCYFKLEQINNSKNLSLTFVDQEARQRFLEDYNLKELDKHVNSDWETWPNYMSYGAFNNLTAENKVDKILTLANSDGGREAYDDKFDLLWNQAGHKKKNDINLMIEAMEDLFSNGWHEVGGLCFDGDRLAITKEFPFDDNGNEVEIETLWAEDTSWQTNLVEHILLEKGSLEFKLWSK